jgi:phosphate starvation-inducible PhoH-like protein
MASFSLLLLLVSVLLSSARKTKPVIGPRFPAQTVNQHHYFRTLRQPQVALTICTGPAGSGKTAMAVEAAVEALRTERVDKLVVTRPMVAVEEEMGFLPGNIVAKMDPWTRPVVDLLHHYFTPAQVTNMLKEGQLEMAPLAFMRGRTFHRCFVIADEMQNSSPAQMLMLATRLGKESVLVVTGDLQQSDRPKLDGHSGLADLVLKCQNNAENPLMQLIQLDHDDIQRSALAQYVMTLYGRDAIKQQQQQQQLPSVTVPVAEAEKKDAGADAALIPKEHLSKYYPARK